MHVCVGQSQWASQRTVVRQGLDTRPENPCPNRSLSLEPSPPHSPDTAPHYCCTRRETLPKHCTHLALTLTHSTHSLTNSKSNLYPKLHRHQIRSHNHHNGGTSDATGEEGVGWVRVADGWCGWGVRRWRLAPLKVSLTSPRFHPPFRRSHRFTSQSYLSFSVTHTSCNAVLRRSGVESIIE